MKRKFSYKISMLDFFLLAIGFGLAFFDMNILKDGIHTVTGADARMAPLLAVFIATTANTFALDWGRRNGLNSEKHSVNKKSLFSFLTWIAFGLAYATIEVISTLKIAEKGNIDWLSQAGQYLLLILSYISSGIAIQKAAREIWDCDAAACRASESEYKILSKQISKEESRIKYLLATLDNYSQNYDTLDEQYKKQLEAINHAEQSVINEILGKTLQDNPSVMPSEAKEVVKRARKDFLEGDNQ